MNQLSPNAIQLCVAPMMGWTDRYCRSFHRVAAPFSRLYSEMVHANAVIHGPRSALAFDPFEQPVALQLGGSDPALLAKATQIADQLGYAEVNLNCGCPSGRVQSGGFGACLMLRPERVVACVQAMVDVSSVPVTVKCRLGVDNTFTYEQFSQFVGSVIDAGASMVIVHARQALLNGVSTKDNHQIPPLCYDWVYRIKRAYPSVPIVLNGGIGTVLEAQAHLEHVDGVMLGRTAYHTPYLLHQLDAALSGRPVRSRAELLM